MQKQRTETKRPGINVPLNVFNKMKCEESSLCQKIHHHARKKILLPKKLNQPLCHYGQARRDRAGAGIFASEKNQNSGERYALPLPSVEQFCPQSPRFAGTRCRALSVDKTEEALQPRPHRLRGGTPTASFWINPKLNRERIPPLPYCQTLAGGSRCDGSGGRATPTGELGAQPTAKERSAERGQDAKTDTKCGLERSDGGFARPPLGVSMNPFVYSI